MYCSHRLMLRYRHRRLQACGAVSCRPDHAPVAKSVQTTQAAGSFQLVPEGHRHWPRNCSRTFTVSKAMADSIQDQQSTKFRYQSQGRKNVLWWAGDNRTGSASGALADATWGIQPFRPRAVISPRRLLCGFPQGSSAIVVFRIPLWFECSLGMCRSIYSALGGGYRYLGVWDGASGDPASKI